MRRKMNMRNAAFAAKPLRIGSALAIAAAFAGFTNISAFAAPLDDISEIRNTGVLIDRTDTTVDQLDLEGNNFVFTGTQARNELVVLGWGATAIGNVDYRSINFYDEAGVPIELSPALAAAQICTYHDGGYWCSVKPNTSYTVDIKARDGDDEVSVRDYAPIAQIKSTKILGGDGDDSLNSSSNTGSSIVDEMTGGTGTDELYSHDGADTFNMDRDNGGEDAVSCGGASLGQTVNMDSSDQTHNDTACGTINIF